MRILDEIGESIVALRKQKGWTQERLALNSGISSSYLRLIEHGEANPTIKELTRIAAVLDIELHNPFDVPVPAIVS